MYKKELGASPFIISIISSLSSAIVALSRLAGGYIADRYGRREVLWRATFLMACSYLLLALAPDWKALLVGHAISSLALFYQPALWSLMADSTVKETRGRVFAVAMFAPGLISTLAPALAVYLVSSLGLVTSMRLVYAGASVAGLVAALIRWRMIRETLPLEARRKLSFLKAYQEAVSFVGRRLLALIVVECSVSIAYSFMLLQPYYSVYYLGMSETEWGIVWLAGSAASLAVSLPGGYLADRVGRKLSLELAVLLELASALLMYTAPVGRALTIVCMSYVLGSTGSSLYFTAIQTIATDLTPPQLRGRVNTIRAMTTDFSFSVASLLAGYAYEQVGPRVPFSLAAVACAANLLMVALAVGETLAAASPADKPFKQDAKRSAYQGERG